MADKEAIRRDRLAGLTIMQIAARHGVVKQYVSKVTRDMEPIKFTVSTAGELTTVRSDTLDPDVLTTRVGKALERLGDDVEYE